MKAIQEMGRFIEAAWIKQRLDEKVFPELACTAIETFKPHQTVSPEEIVQWYAETPPSLLPRQVNIDATFGEPPITLYSGSHFYMEALFWLDGTTAIHQHGFSGAFQVLAGSSIHSTFQFEVSERVNSRMLLGNLVFQGSELLEQGAFRPIRSGVAFVHSLFHLDRPSVTLVIRTYSEPDAQPQWHYHIPHVAVDSFFRPEWLTRMRQTIGMLHRTESPQLLPVAELTIRRGDILSAWCILHDFLVLRPNEEQGLERLLTAARDSHGERVRAFRPALEELRRQRHISARRSDVHGADHRFFLAALLNLPYREVIFDFIRRRYPGQEPSQVIIQCVRELAALKTPRTSAGNPLGFEFEDGELAVLRHLLEGSSPQEVVDLLGRQYDVSGEQDRILELANALQTSLLFRPLFQAAPVAQTV
jgi:hypothetical protein